MRVLPLVVLLACAAPTEAVRPTRLVSRCPAVTPLEPIRYPGRLPEASERLPFGDDLARGLVVLALNYAGPDRPLPLEGMLAGAVERLAAGYPSLRVTHVDGDLVLSGPAVPLHLERVKDLAGLAAELAIVAELARTLPAGADDPEHLLLDGAVGVLAWRPRLIWRAAARPPATAPAALVSRVDADGIAHVTIRRLVEGVADRARAELTAATGLRGVILDLRGNQGGLLSEAVALADVFVRDGCLAVVQGAQRNSLKFAFAQHDDVEVPLLVLVDGTTGSGAELVAATLRALGRARIVGTPTAGGAIIRVAYRLPSGAQLQVPIAALHAGDGSPLDGHPLAPDVVTTDPDERAVALLGAR